MLASVLLVICLSMLTGCQDKKQDGPPAAIGKAMESTGGPTGETGETGSEPAVTITGDGVGHEVKFTLTELKNMEEGSAAVCYSTVNNWPAKNL